MQHRHTYRVAIAYDGRPFAGFARQPGLPTVEACLRSALGRIMPKPPRIAVAGRTDRGVHALGQVVSFRSHEPIDLHRIQATIDNESPDALVSIEVREVGRKFHAQYSAKARRYVYFYPDGDETIEAERVDKMLLTLTGRRCFNAFARDTPSGKTTVRTLLEARARRVSSERRSFIRFDICAEAFLRKQVRILVSTAIRETSDKADDDRLVVIADRGDRRLTADPAPPDGLYLWRVIY